MNDKTRSGKFSTKQTLLKVTKDGKLWTLTGHQKITPHTVYEGHEDHEKNGVHQELVF